MALLISLWISTLAPNALAAPPKVTAPLCMLIGGARKPRASNEGFESLSNLIRVKLAVADEQECRAAMREYCRTSIKDRGFIPEKLTGLFRAKPSSKTGLKFSIDAQCTVTTQVQDR